MNQKTLEEAYYEIIKSSDKLKSVDYIGNRMITCSIGDKKINWILFQNLNPFCVVSLNREEEDIIIGTNAYKTSDLIQINQFIELLGFKNRFKAVRVDSKNIKIEDILLKEV